MTDLFEGYAEAARASPAWDEMFTRDGRVRPESAVVHAVLTGTDARDLRSRVEALATADLDQALEALLADVHGAARAVEDGVLPRRVSWAAVSSSEVSSPASMRSCSSGMVSASRSRPRTGRAPAEAERSGDGAGPGVVGGAAAAVQQGAGHRDTVPVPRDRPGRSGRSGRTGCAPTLRTSPHPSPEAP